jgi:hypothetical protein
LAYPAAKTLHTLLVIVPALALAADATRRGHAMGEWCVCMHAWMDGWMDGWIWSEGPRLIVVHLPTIPYPHGMQADLLGRHLAAPPARAPGHQHGMGPAGHERARRGPDSHHDHGHGAR